MLLHSCKKDKICPWPQLGHLSSFQLMCSTDFRKVILGILLYWITSYSISDISLMPRPTRELPVEGYAVAEGFLVVFVFACIFFSSSIFLTSPPNTSLILLHLSSPWRVTCLFPRNPQYYSDTHSLPFYPLACSSPDHTILMYPLHPFTTPQFTSLTSSAIPNLSYTFLFLSLSNLILAI